MQIGTILIYATANEQTFNCDMLYEFLENVLLFNILSVFVKGGKEIIIFFYI